MSTTAMQLFIGLMSGTSMDGVDGVLAAFTEDGGAIRTLASSYLPFPDALRADLMALQSGGDNEIHREALAANALARLYAECVSALLKDQGISPTEVCAIGAHGQTVRHRPELGYTRQTGNPALMAELTGIDVIADFRSRDIAAGGQGAPLVPAFHQAAFGSADEVRVVANIGGIANISILQPNGQVLGFDTGPGNVLMDYWIGAHQGKTYDAAGAWAASGNVDAGLLQRLLDEAYLRTAPPKSTGRDLFHAQWLKEKLEPFAGLGAADVQATLARFTAKTIVDAIAEHAMNPSAVYVCGGGAYNDHLLRELQCALQQQGLETAVNTTQRLGMPPNQVEALAFAWLARRHVHRLPGNQPAVTGALGLRILGAHYPA